MNTQMSIPPAAFKRNGRPVKNHPANCAKTEDLQAALEHAMAASAAHNLPGSVTVNEALDRWLTLHSIGVKPKTIEFNRLVVQHVRRAWPQVLLRAVADVTEAECLAFAATVAHYSSTRYNGIVNALRTCIPAAKILPRKSPPHPDAKIPTPELFDQLLAALDTCQQGHAGLLVRLLAHTGMRINEARQVKWEDVRDDHLYLRAGTTKNGKPRCVPFIRGTREVLRAYRRVSTGEFVVTQLDCRRAMRYACRLLGCHQFSHHTFRHYFATRCIVSGVDIPTVAKWLGHTDNGVLLLKTYCHLLDEHSRAMAERVKLGGELAAPEDIVELHASRAAALVPPVGNIVPLFQPAPEPSADVAASCQSAENGSANSRLQLREIAAAS
jgi:integrase